MRDYTERSAAEMLKDNSGLLKPMEPFLDLFTLCGGEFKSNRKEQLLRSISRMSKFLKIILIVNPLMCSMLVN
ncbi:hypothetical protein D3C73_1252010 [compost metagenome]